MHAGRASDKEVTRSKEGISSTLEKVVEGVPEAEEGSPRQGNSSVSFAGSRQTCQVVLGKANTGIHRGVRVAVRDTSRY